MDSITSLHIPTAPPNPPRVCLRTHRGVAQRLDVEGLGAVVHQRRKRGRGVVPCELDRHAEPRERVLELRVFWGVGGLKGWRLERASRHYMADRASRRTVPSIPTWQGTTRHARTDLGVGAAVEGRGRDDVVPGPRDERGDGEELRGLARGGGHRQHPACGWVGGVCGGFGGCVVLGLVSSAIRGINSLSCLCL